MPPIRTLRDKEAEINKLLMLSFVADKLKDYPYFNDITAEIRKRMEILFTQYKND